MSAERALAPRAELSLKSSGESISGEGLDVQQYWHMLRKRRVAVGATCLAVVVATMIATFLMRPMFRAEVTIQIERENPNILSFQEILQVDSRQDDFYQTQYMLLQSRTLLRRVIDQLRLYEHREFARELAAMARTRDPGALWDPRLVDLVLDRVRVLPVRRSRLVRIAADTHDRELSAALANSVASSYIDMTLQAKFEATEAATQFLSGQIETLKKEIEQNKKDLQEYAQQSRTVSLDERQNITVQRLTDLNTALTKSEADRIQAESSYRSLMNTLGFADARIGSFSQGEPPPGDVDLGRVPEVATNHLVQTLRASHAGLRTKHAELSQRFKPDWPELVRLRDQMTDLASQIRSEEWRIVAGMLKRSESEYNAALSRERLIREQLDSQRQTVSEMNRSAILYNTLKAEVDNKISLLDSLLKRKNETDVSARLKGLKSSNVRTVDMAEPPVSAFRPNKKLNAVLALAIGLFLGIGVAFFLEYLDNTIKSVDDIERYTGLASLGVIPLIATGGVRGLVGDGRGAGGEGAPGEQLVTLRDARSAVSEAYRSLRTSILLSSAGSPPRFLLVTSSQPSEGKTTTVVNTAIALAQAGKKVLLIDADLRKPRCHRLLGLPNKNGLTTFLTGSADLKDIIQLTPVPNLFVLTSGPIPPNPSELLGSGRVKDLMTLIPPAVDHILFDSPPILTVTDATLLAALVDGVVLVVRAGQSPRELVRRTHKQLRDVGARIVGVVLNSVDAKSTDYYYHYYSSAYTHYGNEPEEAR